MEKTLDSQYVALPNLFSLLLPSTALLIKKFFLLNFRYDSLLPSMLVKL